PTMAVTMNPRTPRAPSTRRLRQRLQRLFGRLATRERLLRAECFLELCACLVGLAIGDQRHRQVVVHEPAIRDCGRGAAQVCYRLVELALSVTNPAIGVEVGRIVRVAEGSHEIVCALIT